MRISLSLSKASSEIFPEKSGVKPEEAFFVFTFGKAFMLN